MRFSWEKGNVRNYQYKNALLEQAAMQIFWSIRLLRFGYLDNLTLSAR